MSDLVSIGFFFNDAATTEIYTLSLHDALPILAPATVRRSFSPVRIKRGSRSTPLPRSEEHTSELQSPVHLVCRLLLEKKKILKLLFRLEHLPLQIICLLWSDFVACSPLIQTRI